MENVNPYASPTAAAYGTYNPPGSVAVSEGTISELAQTKPWVRFLAFLSAIGCVFIVLGALAVFGMSAMGGLAGNGGPGAAGFVGIGLMYILVAILMIYPTARMFGYAKKIDSLLQSRHVGDLEAALSEQRRIWRFYGILMAIYLVVVVFGIGAAVILPLVLK